MNIRPVKGSVAIKSFCDLLQRALKEELTPKKCGEILDLFLANFETMRYECNNADSYTLARRQLIQDTIAFVTKKKNDRVFVVSVNMMLLAILDRLNILNAKIENSPIVVEQLKFEVPKEQKGESISHTSAKAFRVLVSNQLPTSNGFNLTDEAQQVRDAFMNGDYLTADSIILLSTNPMTDQLYNELSKLIAEEKSKILSEDKLKTLQSMETAIKDRKNKGTASKRVSGERGEVKNVESQLAQYYSTMFAPLPQSARNANLGNALPQSDMDAELEKESYDDPDLQAAIEMSLELAKAQNKSRP